MIELGVLALRLALVVAVYAVVAATAGARMRRPDVVATSRTAAYATFALIVLAVAVLLAALLRHDFSLEYVAAYSSSTLATPYTVAALWGGQAGSLLFWVFILTSMSALVHLQNRDRNEALMPYVTATLMTIAVFFLALLVFITDPFERLPVPAREGADLNPLI
jgi:cytochrome c-type biogenesis protein CcmF